MAKFYGAIGYVEETNPSVGVVVEKPIEKFYRGDLIRGKRTLEKGEGLNDDIGISNQISIVADPYAINHMFAMRYVKMYGAAWKVTSVDVEHPRLILTLGGVYNGEVANGTGQ